MGRERPSMATRSDAATPDRRSAVTGAPAVIPLRDLAGALCMSADPGCRRTEGHEHVNHRNRSLGAGAVSARLYVHIGGPQHTERRRGRAVLHLGSAHSNGVHTQRGAPVPQGLPTLGRAAHRASVQHHRCESPYGLAPRPPLSGEGWKGGVVPAKAGMRAIHTQICNPSANPFHWERAEGEGRVWGIAA